MSIRAIACVWERSNAKGSNLLMLLAIADYAKDDGRNAWPSTRTLAAKTRLSERSAWLILSKLAEDGELEIDNDTTPGRRLLNVRCVFENWPTKPEMLRPAAPPAKFSGGLTPPGVQSLHPTPAAEPADPPAPLLPATGDPDPLEIRQEEEQEQGGSLAAPVDAVENLAVIRKLAHGVLARNSATSVGELAAALRAECEEHRIAYDPAVISLALAGAMVTRAGGSKRGR